LEGLRLELGDVLWYVSQLATELNLSLDEIAEANLAKLASRVARDVIAGSGDRR
jgi:NTP pyrophosphatase (non-canonical NTP hydrolase)